jgi:hypothetical protein
MAPSLLSPFDMPVIDGIKIPLNLYVVLKEPALLAGMSYPGIHRLGHIPKAFIFCLRFLLGGYNNPSTYYQE